MKRNPMKRGICLMLALVMVLSMMPVQAYAAGTEHHEHTMEEETAYHLLQQQAEGLLLEARDASSGESREEDPCHGRAI